MFLDGDLAEQEMRAADQAAREAGVTGVPSFFLDGYNLFSGAMPAETIAEALRRGRARPCGSASGRKQEFSSSTHPDD